MTFESLPPWLLCNETKPKLQNLLVSWCMVEMCKTQSLFEHQKRQFYKAGGRNTYTTIDPKGSSKGKRLYLSQFVDMVSVTKFLR